jgi:signal peptidase II
MISTAQRRIILILGIAAIVLALDQFTKHIVLKLLDRGEEKVVLDGFFKFVNWGNTGAAWSLFKDHNGVLAVVSALALAGLLVWHRHFHIETLLGRVSLGLICGGIAGNLVDRVNPAGNHQVVDFLRFYLVTRSYNEIGFPAFNVADSAICVGVGLLIILSFRLEAVATPQPARRRDSDSAPAGSPRASEAEKWNGVP